MVGLTKSRKIPTRNISPLMFVSRYMTCSASFGDQMPGEAYKIPASLAKPRVPQAGEGSGACATGQPPAPQPGAAQWVAAPQPKPRPQGTAHRSRRESEDPEVIVPPTESAATALPPRKGASIRSVRLAAEDGQCP